MLSRKNRFHGHNALNFTYRKGRSVKDDLVSLKYTNNPKRRNFRVAVVVSKKVSKSAVKRNKIRRRIYQIVRDHSKRIKPSYDLVFTVYSLETYSLEYKQLEEIIKQLLERAAATA